MRSPPYLLVSLRTPACPGFRIFGDRKSSCFDRSGGLGWVGGEWGVTGCLRDDALKRLCRGDRDLGDGRGSFERVQMGGSQGGEISVAGGRLGSGLCRGDEGRVSGMGSFERVQMKVAGGGPAPSRSFGAAAAAPFERVQMSLPGGSVDGDDTDSRRCAMQLRK
jgi:hypothetical protein